MKNSKRELLLRHISEDFKSADIMPYLIRAFEIGYDDGYASYIKVKATTDLEKIPDWILIRDLTRKVKDLEQKLESTQKELEKSKVVDGEKLHNASIEIQREKMYGKLQAEVQKERRRATQLSKEVVELRLKLNKLKE